MSKVTLVELNEINFLKQEINKGLSVLGSLELEKDELKVNLRSRMQEFESVKSNLRYKYGDIDLNTETGEFTVLEKKEAQPVDGPN